MSYSNIDGGMIDPNAKGLRDETGYHLEALQCVGCEKEFSNTIRDESLDDSQRYCGNCFFYKFGLSEYQKILNSTTEFFKVVWHTPIKELPKDILKQIKWVDKSYPERAGLL